MRDFQRISSHILTALFAVFCLTMLYVLVAGWQSQRVTLLQPANPSVKDGWYYLGYYDRKFEVQTLPTKIPAVRGKAAIYRDLPQTSNGDLYLGFTTHHQNVTVSIDGDIIYQQEQQPKPRWITSYQSLYHIVRLPSEIAPNAHLCIQTQALVPSCAGEFSEIMLGNKADVANAILYGNMGAFLFGLSLVVAAVFLAGTSYLFMRTNSGDFTLLHLSLLTLCIGLWQLENSHVLQFYIGYLPLHWCLAYFSQLFMPLLTFLFLCSINDERKTKIMQVLFWGCVAVVTVQFLLQLTGIATLADTVFLSHLLYVGFCVYAIVALRKQEWLRNSWLKQLFIISMSCSGIIFIATFFMFARSRVSSNIITVGLALTVLSMIMLAYKRQLKHFEAVNQAETYKNLAFVDLATGVANKTAWYTLIDNFNEQSPQGEYCIMLFDMNNLKKINDVHGHLVGDQVISAFCHCLTDIIGERGTVYRIGGDEFVCLCYNLPREYVTTMLYQFDAAVEAQRESEYPFAAAYGYDFFTPHKPADFEAATSRADEKMYERKLAMKTGHETRRRLR